MSVNDTASTDSHSGRYGTRLADIMTAVAVGAFVIIELVGTYFFQWNGGGLSRMALPYERVPELWKRYVFSEPNYIATTLMPPRFGDSSGVRGAAWLWPES